MNFVHVSDCNLNQHYMLADGVDVPWQVEKDKHGGDEKQHLGYALLGPRRCHVATGRSHF